MGVSDGSIGMGCNAVHIPDAREGELTREIGLMTRHDLESFLAYLEDAQQTRGSPVKPETIILGLKPIVGQELSGIYKPSDTPLELRSRQQIIVQLKEKAKKLTEGIDITTPYGKIQYYILRKSLNSLIESIETGDEFYKLFYGFTRLLPYIVEQIPQDEARNIFVARDAGVYNIVRGLQKKHGVRESDEDKNTVFHLSRKEMGDAQRRMKQITQTAGNFTYKNEEEYMNYLLDVFSEEMKKDDFSKLAEKIYKQLTDAGIVNDQQNTYRIVDDFGYNVAFFIGLTIRYKAQQSDQKLEQIARTEYPETQLLRKVNGVGPLIALTFVLTLEDRGRFEKSRDVGCYVGLRPKRSESGESQPQLRITKEGDIYLRKMLVQGAHCILSRRGPDTDLKRWGLRLAVLLHLLWVTGATYEPLRNSTAKQAAA